MLWLWGNLSYIIALLAGTGLVAYKMPKRDRFVIRVIVSVTVICAAKLLLDWFFIQGRPLSEVIFLNTFFSFVLYALTCGGVAACFKCDFYGAVFCGTAGYCMQHISQRTDRIFKTLVLPSPLHPALSAVILIAITALEYVGIFFALIRKQNYRGIVVDNKIQLIIAAMVVVGTIFVNTFAMWQTDDKYVKVYIMLFSVFVGILGLMLEFNMLSRKTAERENAIITRINRESEENYKFEKSMIDLVNIKCHDLKHRIGISQQSEPDTLDDVKEVVESYDSIFETGSKALDVVLVKKGRVCREKGIGLTCLADGKKLGFMKEADIYTLFGNMLDNAIEATDKVVEEDKRIICLNVFRKGVSVCIQISNYYDDEIVYYNGLPQTKKDKFSHGYGMQSIKLIVDKYGGDLKISDNDGIFLIDLLFMDNSQAEID